MQDEEAPEQGASKLKSDAKQQHYVPQFLLRNFAPPSDLDQTFTYTFNKNEGRSYPSSIGKTASQFRYNEIEIHEGMILETALAGMEGEASSAFTEIIKKERVDTLTDDQRYQIALFIAVQIGRTPTFRDEVSQFSQALGVHIGHENWSRYSFEPLSKDDLIYASALFASKTPEIIPAILDKVWFLHEAPTGSRFIIGDHAVAQWHSKNATGNQYHVPGLDEVGAQINLPISPKLTLSLWCNTLIKNQTGFTLDQLRQLRGRRSPPERKFIAFSGEFTYPAKPGNVDHLNFIQTVRANRCVFGHMDDFSDIAGFIAKDPTLKSPPQWHFPDDVLDRAANDQLMGE